MGVCSDQSRLCTASDTIQCCTNGTLQVNAEMLKEYVILAGVNLSGRLPAMASHMPSWAYYLYTIASVLP